MLLGYIWLLGKFVNSSCDIKINVNIVQNSCRNLAVRGLNMFSITRASLALHIHIHWKLVFFFILAIPSIATQNMTCLQDILRIAGL